MLCDRKDCGVDRFYGCDLECVYRVSSPSLPLMKWSALTGPSIHNGGKVSWKPGSNIE